MRLSLGIVLFILLFAACATDRDEPCRAVHIDTIPLDASLNSLMPYDWGDSAWYRYNRNDSIVAVFETDEWREIKSVNINPECPNDTIIYLGKWGVAFPIIGNPKSFYIDYIISSMNRNLGVFLGTELSEQEILTGKPFLDSMEVENKIYTRVFRVSEGKDTIYFNREFGFIKMVRDTNTWELIR